MGTGELNTSLRESLELERPANKMLGYYILDQACDHVIAMRPPGWKEALDVMFRCQIILAREMPTDFIDGLLKVCAWKVSDR